MIQHAVAYLDKLIVGYHCLKSVQMRSVFWSVFSLNAGKYGPGKTPYLDTFHPVGSVNNSADENEFKEHIKNETNPSVSWYF